MKKKNSLLPLALLAILGGCGENSNTVLQSEVKKIAINETNATIHTTDDATQLHATVTYTDNTTADATDAVSWSIPTSSYSFLTMLAGSFQATSNENNTTAVKIAYGNLYEDNATLNVTKLNSVTYSPSDVNTTGEHVFTVKGNFDNGDANVSMKANISWATDANATFVSYDENRSELTLQFSSFPATVAVVMFENNITTHTFTGK